MLARAQPLFRLAICRCSTSSQLQIQKLLIQLLFIELFIGNLSRVNRAKNVFVHDAVVNRPTHTCSSTRFTLHSRQIRSIDRALQIRAFSKKPSRQPTIIRRGLAFVERLEKEPMANFPPATRQMAILLIDIVRLFK